MKVKVLMKIFKKLLSDLSASKDAIQRQLVTSETGSNGVMESLQIPEPTKSLLWITDENTSMIENASSVTIVMDGTNLRQKENGFYSEPSLIWTKLPIKPNNDLIQSAMYWPTYSSFTPEARYQYLKWLGDITQPTNLSYVFLYFYGLERHLIVGDYDAAVDEIGRLLMAHPKKSFVDYASRSLIVASLGIGRVDIVDRLPLLLEQEIDEALALRIIKGTSMTPEDVISISSKVGFNNKRYIKLYPDEFKEELQKNIDEFEQQFGNLLSNFALEDFKREESSAFANLSILEHSRGIKVPVILEDKKFSNGMRNLLSAAHDGVKNRIANGDIIRPPEANSAPPEQLRSIKPVADTEVNALINDLSRENKNILDLHFAILEKIREYYSLRKVDDNYHKAIVACRAQIKLQAKAAKQFLSEYPEQVLPAHTGYSQLIIIMTKEKKFQEALDLAKEAKANGWNGDWDKRIESLKAKI